MYVCIFHFNAVTSIAIIIECSNDLPRFGQILSDQVIAILSLYKSASLSVSLFDCLFDCLIVCLFVP